MKNINLEQINKGICEIKKIPTSKEIIEYTNEELFAKIDKDNKEIEEMLREE